MGSYRKWEVYKELAFADNSGKFWRNYIIKGTVIRRMCIREGGRELVTEVYDIVSEDGTRVATCRRENGHILIQGKSGCIPLQQFVAQATNPSLAKQMKSRRSKKNIERRATRISG